MQPAIYDFVNTEVDQIFVSLDMAKALTSIFLIVIVLLGSIGVNYDTHYCGGILVDQQLSFMPSHLSCGMSMNTADMDVSDESSTHISEVCCANHHLGFQITDEYNDYHASSFLFISNSSFPRIVVDFTSFTKERDYNFIGYSPPPPSENILLKKESFLI